MANTVRDFAVPKQYIPLNQAICLGSRATAKIKPDSSASSAGMTSYREEIELTETLMSPSSRTTDVVPDRQDFS